MKTCRVRAVAMCLGTVLLTPALASAQVKTMVSGGFRAAYNLALPEFERISGITVTTGGGASQGAGPNTIGAQLARGVAADVLIMSREGLDDLIKAGRIAAGTAVDLARTPVGVAVRIGAPRPDISSVEAFRRALLQARTVAFVDSTVGIYLRTTLFPRLGIADQLGGKLATTGVAGVVAGDADFTIQPLSEITNVAGAEVVGTIPPDLQFISVFAAAIVSNAAHPDAAKQLIDFFASDRARDAITRSGMEQIGRP